MHSGGPIKLGSEPPAPETSNSAPDIPKTAPLAPIPAPAPPKPAAKSAGRSIEITETYFASCRDLYECFTDMGRVKALIRGFVMPEKIYLCYTHGTKIKLVLNIGRKKYILNLSKMNICGIAHPRVNPRRSRQELNLKIAFRPPWPFERLYIYL